MANLIIFWGLVVLYVLPGSAALSLLDKINGGGTLSQNSPLRSAPCSLGAFISLLPFERPTTALKGEEVEEEKDDDDLSAVRFVLVPAVPGMQPSNTASIPTARRGCGFRHWGSKQQDRKEREGIAGGREGGRQTSVLRSIGVTGMSHSVFPTNAQCGRGIQSK